MDFNLTLIGQTVAMIVFVWFCMKWIWPPVMQAIDKRRKEIADGIAAGEKGYKELADAKLGADGILTDARQKAVQVVDIAHKRSSDLVGETDARHEFSIHIGLTETDPPRGVVAGPDGVTTSFGGWLELMHALSELASAAGRAAAEPQADGRRGQL